MNINPKLVPGLLVLSAILAMVAACATNEPGGHNFNNGLGDAPVNSAAIVSESPDRIWNNPDGYRNILCRDLHNGLYAYVASGNDYGADGNIQYLDTPCVGAK